MSFNRKAADFLAFLLPIGAILFVFRNVTFFDKIFSHSDVIHNYFPYFYSLSKSHSLVEPSIISGFPIFTSVSTTWFFPLNQLLFNFLDAFSVFRLLDVTYILLAYLFTYLYLRKIGMSKNPSILAGVIYIFSGQVMLWSETIIISSYYTLLPLSLYLFEHGLRTEVKYRRFIFYTLTGVFFGFGWLSGHVQWAIYIHTFFFTYFLYFSYFERFQKTLKHFLKHALTFLYIVAISFLIGFPQIYSLVNFLPVTERADGVPMSVVYASAYLPHHLIHYFIPSFDVPYLPISAAFHNYIGIFPILLFIFSLFFIRRLFEENRFYRFFIGVFVFCFIASIKYSPLTFLIHQLPFYNTFREFVRIMFIGDFALAIVISIFLDYLLKNKEVFLESLQKYMSWIKRLFVYLALPCVLLATSVDWFFADKIKLLLKQYFLDHLFSSRIGGFPIEHYYSLIDRYVTQSLSQVSLSNFQVLSFVVFSILSYLLMKRVLEMDSKTFWGLAILLVTFNFAFVYKDRVVAISRGDYLDPPKTAQFILSKEESPDSFRIMTPFADIALFNESISCNFDSLGGWDMSYEEFLYQKELIEPNSNIIYGLHSAEGYEPYMPHRTSDMIGYLGSRWAVADTPSLSGEKSSVQSKIDKLSERVNLFRVMNVRYLVSPFVIQDPELKEVFFEKVGDCGSEVRIYEVNDIWPRYFVTNKVDFISSEEPFLSFVEKMNKMNKPTILLEDEGSIKTGTDYFSELKYSGKPDNMTFEIYVKSPGYLFLGNAWMPDWHAAIDGKLARIVRANYMYMAVYVEAGRHKVNLYYKERSLKEFISDSIK